MSAASIRNCSRPRAIPVLWLLIWSNFQPLISAQTPVMDSRTCSSETDASCVQYDGVSLLQAKSRMTRMEAQSLSDPPTGDAAAPGPTKFSMESCTVCKEIASTVKSTVKREVSMVMEKAKVMIEQEFLRQVLVRHNSTMKELEKIVDKQVKADLANKKKIQKVEEKVNKDFVDKKVIEEMNSKLDGFEERLTELEKEIKEVTAIIADIKISISNVSTQTETFVNETKTKINEIAVFIKDSSATSRTVVMKKAVTMIQTETNKFVKEIIEQTETRITEKTSTTLVKIEHIIKDSVETEKQAAEEKRESIKEKIEDNWEEINTQIKELQTAIKESVDAAGNNQKEIKAIQDSIKDIVIQTAEKVIAEHSKITEGSLDDLAASLEDLAITVDEEMDASAQREDDIDALRDLLEATEENVIKANEEYIKKEVETVIKSSNEAMKGLEIQIGNVKSASDEDKARLEKLMNDLKKMKESVETGKEERIQNTKAIATLKANANVVKDMISEVKTDLEVHKESHELKTLEEVKILLSEAQKSTIEKAKELSVKEMTHEIISVKDSLETKIKSTVLVMEEGLKATQEEEKNKEKKLMETMESLKKQVNLNAETSKELSADQESLKKAITQIEEIIELGKEEHKLAKADLMDLKEYVESVAGDVEATKEQFPSKEELEALENSITKVDAKVTEVSSKVEKEAELRELSISAVEERVLANQDHLDELEDEIAGMSEQIIDVASIIQEMNEGLATVTDDAVKAALAATKTIVQESTETVIKSGMDKVRKETKEMVSQVTQSVTVLEKRLGDEKAKREKADEQLGILQKKVTALSQQMEEKADASTIQKVSQVISVITETVRGEKEARTVREKETKMIKSALVSLFHRTQKKEKEIQVVREIHEVQHVHHVIKVESKTKIMEVSNSVTELENAAEAGISKLKADLKAAQDKLAADEAARTESDAALQRLSESTTDLFQKVASNSEKITMLDTRLTEEIDYLQQSLSEASIKMQVSADASKSDSGRISKLLETLSADLAAEGEARKAGDSGLEKTINDRIQVLIEEMVAVTKSVSSGGLTKTHCSCQTESENGVSHTVCRQDGEVVDACKDSEGKVLGETTPAGEIPKPTAAPVSTSCVCETAFKASGELGTVCKKGGNEIAQADWEAQGCDPHLGMDNLGDMMGNGENSGKTLEEIMGTQSLSLVGKEM
eukprot:gnl/MRDRNA2_/MRDRNA2_88072_c0_seq1.p1 gnl/MRDRNA2_/MRDRNA2_88072_c0~~gnl/MRDRNA2_/MRDRNA2_88072_c0_seq1.p1  ORF type:complete len:1236 (+),score=364.48 gnl/MRDRNA2_/MRDRNA2_88072_c0_seq1:120-3710(+)